MTADEKTWIYWVPCALDGGEERWLQIKSSPSLDKTTTNTNTNTKPTLTSNTYTAKVYSILGHQVAEVLDDAQLSGILGTGKLKISLKHAQEVRGVVDVSRRSSEGLRAFLS